MVELDFFTSRRTLEARGHFGGKEIRDGNKVEALVEKVVKF